MAYDTQQLYHNHSAWSFVLWHNLEGVRNRSIQKSAKYRNEIKPFQPKPAFYREDLEAISQNFQLKYVLAIMNSSFAQQWLAHKRRSKLRIYPEDWKPLPIAAIPRAEQQPLVDLVDSILGEFATYGHPLPAEAVGRVAAWEREIDAAVYTIYGIAPEQVAAIAAAAPTDVGESDEDGEG